MTDREDALLRNVRRQLALGFDAVRDLNAADDLEEELGSQYEDHLQAVTETLGHTILQSERALRLLIETQGLSNFLDDFIAAMDKVGRAPKISYVGGDPELAYNVALSEIDDWLELVAPSRADLPRHRGKRRVLANLLHHLPEIMAAQNVTPTREHDVQTFGHRILQLAFPDAVREVPIPQPAKTYKPDIGIGSIRMGIELKFADSVAEAKKALDELLTDMAGFNKSSDYDSFIGVIYMTGPHLSRQIMQAHMERVGSPKTWSAFPVIGAGARPKAKSSPKPKGRAPAAPAAGK